MLCGACSVRRVIELERRIIVGKWVGLCRIAERFSFKRIRKRSLRIHFGGFGIGLGLGSICQCLVGNCVERGLT